MHKEVQAQESHQIRKAPPQAAAHLEILQEQDRDECCPNLDVHRIGAGSHEGFDFQVLFDGFEEEFNLPALLVDGGNRARGQLHVVCQQDDFAPAHRIPDDHPTQETELPFVGPAARQVDHLVGEDVALGGGEHRFGCRSSIALEPRDKEDVSLGEAVQKSIIHVTAINGDNGTFRPVEGSGHADLMGFTLGDDSKAGQASIVIEEQVQFDGPLGAAELRPVEYFQAKVNDRCIQAVELVLEAKGLRGRDSLAAPEQLHEDLFEELPGPVRIGVGKSRTLRGIPDAKMVELSLHAGKPSANLTKTVRSPKLAEEHRHELRPAIKAFGRPVCPVSTNRFFKFRARKKTQQLAEHTVKLPHDGEPPVGEMFVSSPPFSCMRGSLFNFSIPCFGQECCYLYSASGTSISLSASITSVQPGF